MEFFSPFIPTESWSIVILIIQSILALGLVVYFIKVLFKLSKVESDVKNHKNVSNLATALTKSTSLTEAEKQREFKDFAKNLDTESVVYTHLNALYTAGMKQSNIDVKALIQNTSTYLTKPNHFFRSLFSLFIILGLLGTLIGLASSLTKLSGNHKNESNILSAEVQPVASPNELYLAKLKSGVDSMLRSLNGAFAPSIWGVLLTIIFILFYLVLLKKSQDLCLKIETETISNWGLLLLPTTSRHLYNQLERYREQLEESHNLAKEIEENAESIKKNSLAIAEEFETSKVRFKELREATKNLIEFSQNFGDNLAKFPTLQDDLQQLNKEILDQSELLRQNVEESINIQKAFSKDNSDFVSKAIEVFNRQQEDQKVQFSNQNTELNTILNSLKLYEEAYITSRKSLDDNIVKTLTAAENAYNKLEQQNGFVINQIVQAFGDPLKEQLIASLNTVPTNLVNINNTLKNTNIPLEKTVSEIQEIARFFEQRTHLLVDQIAKKVGLLNSEVNDLTNKVVELNKLNNQQNDSNVEKSQYEVNDPLQNDNDEKISPILTRNEQRENKVNDSPLEVEITDPLPTQILNKPTQDRTSKPSTHSNKEYRVVPSFLKKIKNSAFEKIKKTVSKIYKRER